jgi:predicted glycoside hydrolase/deacetylase ChbG (UPF0249 family)
MVRWPAAAAAAAYARGRSALSVGLHIDLGEWVLTDGAWAPSYEVIDTDDEAAVAAEVDRQLQAFRALMHADPTHLDSHQHVHRSEPVNRIVTTLGRRLGIPVRGASAAVGYVGSFYGQGSQGEAIEGALTVAHLTEIVRALPGGTTELGCHPGLGDDCAGMYIHEREREVEVLCDPRVRAALTSLDIELISFRDLSSLRPGTPRI